jgi:Pectate lyase superfamily protein
MVDRAQLGCDRAPHPFENIRDRHCHNPELNLVGQCQSSINHDLARTTCEADLGSNGQLKMTPIDFGDNPLAQYMVPSENKTFQGPNPLSTENTQPMGEHTALVMTGSPTDSTSGSGTSGQPDTTSITDTSPTAPAVATSITDTSPAAPASATSITDTSPAAPAVATSITDTSPQNSSSGLESPLSTNKSDYGANENIAFDPQTMVNGEDFGAVGDGQTDDTQALNKALAAAQAQGKNVYLPAGTYNHNGQIEADSAGLIGAGNTILEATDPGDSDPNGTSQRAIHVTGSNVMIENLTLDATSTIPRYGPPDADAIHIEGSNVTVDHVTVDGGNQAEGNFNAGIHAESTAGAINNVTITNDLVENTNADRIRVAAWNGNTVSNVLVENNMTVSVAGGAPGDDDYSAIGNNNSIIQNYQAIGNVSIGPKQWGQGFDMEGVQGSSEITGNYINFGQDGHAPGIIIQTPSDYPGPATIGLTVSGNVLDGTGRNDSRGPLGAIAVDQGDAQDISISNNTIGNSASEDISVLGTGTKSNISIIGNTDPLSPLSLDDQLPGAVVGQP